MHQHQKLLLRAADQIRLNLQRLRVMTVAELPEGDWQYCQSLVRQLDRAQRAGWINAAAVLLDRYERALAGCAGRLHEVSRQVSSSARVAVLPTVREIFCELSGLGDEFENVNVDLQSQTLSVTTAPIVLEEIGLGRFQIQLHWNRIGERRPYDVVALDPNPAGESSDTTHPHVKGERLCEGDGQLAIDLALRGGRVGDFFQIVNRILNTYNSGSAYVPLCDWGGTPCTGCGDVLREDDETACDRCSDILCRNCLICCERCERLCCHSCTNYCGGCEAQICASCEQNCSGCQRVCCSGCLCETGLCEECTEEEHAEAFDDDETPPDEIATTAVPTAGETTPVPSAASTAI